jgi:uncharacterized protein (TIGR02265 family)
MSETVDKRLKGVIFIGYATYIRKKGGLHALENCSKEIGLDLTKLIEEKWYPDTYSLMLIQWVGKNFGPEACRQMGHATVAQRGVISAVARLAGVRKVLESAQKELNDTINFGKVTCVFNDRGATMILKDLIADPVECEVWTGVFEGLMKISGSKGTVKKLTCQKNGGDSCRYELAWK